MRGKVAVCGDLCNNERITPAYAGKSCKTSAIRPAYEDHPRLCGEKEMKSSPISSPIGSPPPMRGKVIGLCLTAVLLRITPAYAGKSFSSDGTSVNIEDHPRLCGEKCQESTPRSTTAGSPPPMRGKELIDSRPCPVYRITPAYAGKSH